MSDIEFLDPQGPGGSLGRAGHFAQGVRVGDRIETSAQGGWRDPDGHDVPSSLHDEIAQAFLNIERILNQAGSSWPDVVKIRTFHGHDEWSFEADEIVADQLRTWMPNQPGPLWTGVGFKLPGAMRFKIAVEAVLREHPNDTEVSGEVHQ